MGINFYPFMGMNVDEFKDPLFVPIHPHRDEWVKLNPHSYPFPIHPPCPESTPLSYGGGLVQDMALYGGHIGPWVATS